MLWNFVEYQSELVIQIRKLSEIKCERVFFRTEVASNTFRLWRWCLCLHFGHLNFKGTEGEPFNFFRVRVIKGLKRLFLED